MRIFVFLSNHPQQQQLQSDRSAGEKDAAFVVVALIDYEEVLHGGATGREVSLLPFLFCGRTDSNAPIQMQKSQASFRPIGDTVPKPPSFFFGCQHRESGLLCFTK